MKLYTTVTTVLLVLIFFTPLYASKPYYPITIESCQGNMVFTKKPERAVFHDLNMLQMALALELEPYIVGVSGITGWYPLTTKVKKLLENIPEITPKYLALEPLLNVKPDFLFAGWNYGLKLGSELTPESLKRFGIQTLVLTESCAHLKKFKIATMDLLYNDMITLGRIFNKEKEAKALVASWKDELASIQKKEKSASLPRVFFYDSGVDAPYTSGRFAMPEALITTAGGKNIMHDALFSWGTTSWETVAVANPDLIILVNYETNHAEIEPKMEEVKNMLRKHPLMRTTNAVKNNKFLVLQYNEITPSPNNIDAIKKIASVLY